MAAFGQTVIPQRQSAPSIAPVEVERGSGEYRVSDDQAIPLPNHPPIDAVPPMPFPKVSTRVGGAELKPVPDSGPGGLVEYDIATGAVQLDPDSQLPPGLKLLIGQEYPGADGGGGSEFDNANQRINGSMTVVANTAVNPWRRIVKIIMRFQNAMGQNEFASCSGTMIDAETVLTAGNCVNEFGGRGWAREVWVYPGWDGEGGMFPEIVNPYGYGTASTTSLYAPSEWVNAGDADFDLGAIVINRAAGMLTGWFAFSAAGNCNFHLAQNYSNASYPSETCSYNLHTGTTMYFWNGAIDNCIGNQFQLLTAAGCTNAIWGGQNGSALYYVNANNIRTISAVTSSSDRATEAFYTRLTQEWVDFTNDSIIPAARGNLFDLQALQVEAYPNTVLRGANVTINRHLAANPTNGTADDTFIFRVYLSSNSTITDTDTFLGAFSYNHEFDAMSSFSVGPTIVNIPAGTPAGDYYLGVRYNDDTDGNRFNNASNTWDAFPLRVNSTDEPPDPPCTCPLDCLIRTANGIPQGLRNLLPAGLDPLALAHQYRDDVMAQSPLGRRYISLYYEHGPELSQLMTQKPAVGTGSVRMLGRITPNLVRMLEGSSAALTEGDRRAALELIELVDVHASPQLRTALTEVRGDLAAGKLDRMFQTDEPSRRPVLSAAVLRWTGTGLILGGCLMAMFWRRRPVVAVR